jgi:chromate transporter
LHPAEGSPRPADHGDRSSSLGELARLFLKLGTIAFGGPAAHIAMMEDEVVRRRGWLSREEFLDYVGATNLIPGPNSTELAIHIGHARAGWPGLLVAGVCFILPAVLIVVAVAWTYVRFGSLPEATWLFYGIKPVVIAIVAQALWGLGRTALKTRGLWVLGGAAIIGASVGVNELLVLLLSGAAMGVFATTRWRAGAMAVVPGHGLFGNPANPMAAAVMAMSASAASVKLGTLFGVFAKAGAILFGSGYVLLAYLRADLVERLHWLTEAQLLDAVAVGQVTPGPVFTTATFIGYVLGGGIGATVATVGIFLPAFIYVAASGPILPRLRRSRVAAAVLDGVNVASLALMAVVTVQLGATALVDPLAIALVLISLVLLLRFRVNSAWLVLGGAIVGVIGALAS